MAEPPPVAVNLDPDLAARSECRLVTIGRTTGQPRELRIWFSVANGRVYLLAAERETHWVRNVRVDPRVRIRFKDRAFEGVARFVEGDPAEPVARAAMESKYGTKYLGKWLREALPVEIELTGEVAP